MSKLTELQTLANNLVGSGFVTDSASGAFQRSYETFTQGTTQAVTGLDGMSQFRTAAALALNDFAPILAEAQSRANTAIDSCYPQQAQANEQYNDDVYYAGEPGAEDDARTDRTAADARANGYRADYEAAFFGHHAEDYGASAAREIDESHNPAIVSFRESQHGFFYGSETVPQFDVRRG